MPSTPPRWRRPHAARPLWPAALLLGAGLGLGAALDLESPVQAASPDAWEQFQADVAAACSQVAGLQEPQVRLDPFGTASYGVARVTGRDTAGHRVTVVCVLRKTPEGPADVEVSAPLQDWVTLR